MTLPSVCYTSKLTCQTEKRKGRETEKGPLRCLPAALVDVLAACLCTLVLSLVSQSLIIDYLPGEPCWYGHRLQGRAYS